MKNIDHPGWPTTANVMGGNGSPNNTKPFGNLFTGITYPVRNDGGIVNVVYYVYAQTSDDILASATAIGVDFVDANIDGTESECDLLGYTTGVLARMAKTPVNSGGSPGPEAGLGLAFPNPAAEQATVPYVLPSGTKTAKLILREVMTGRIVKSYDLPVQLESNIQVDLSQFRNGLYGYTLEADGKQIATRILEVKH